MAQASTRLAALIIGTSISFPSNKATLPPAAKGCENPMSVNNISVMMMEKFGPLTFALALVVRGDRLYFIPRKWFLLRLRMPNFLLPKSNTFETVKDGRFEFHVDLRVPFIGRIAKYNGWLEKT